MRRSRFPGDAGDHFADHVTLRSGIEFHECGIHLNKFHLNNFDFDNFGIHFNSLQLGDFRELSGQCRRRGFPF